MRRFAAILTLWLIAVFAVSCESKGQENSPAVDVRAQQIAVIDSLEAVLKAADGDLNVDLGMAMVSEYDAFTEAFPQDSMTIKYWYRAGEVSRNLPGRELYAIAYYSNIHQGFPDHKLADEAVFMTGVCFDQLGDKERATKTFTHFLETYPNHEWAAEAQEMLMLNSDTTDLDSQVNEWLEKANNQ